MAGVSHPPKYLITKSSVGILIYFSYLQKKIKI